MKPTRTREFFIRIGVGIGVGAAGLALVWFLRGEGDSVPFRSTGKVSASDTSSLQRKISAQVGGVGAPLEIEEWTQQGWKQIDGAEPPPPEAREFTADAALQWERRDLQSLHTHLQSVSFSDEDVPALERLAVESTEARTRWLSVEALGRVLGTAAQSVLTRMHREAATDWSEKDRHWLLGQVRADSEVGRNYLLSLVQKGALRTSGRVAEWNDAAERVIVYALAEGWDWQKTHAYLRPSQESQGYLRRIWEKYQGSASQETDSHD